MSQPEVVKLNFVLMMGHLFQLFVVRKCLVNVVASLDQLQSYFGSDQRRAPERTSLFISDSLSFFFLLPNYLFLEFGFFRVPIFHFLNSSKQPIAMYFVCMWF
jgi:hypothetical protein